MDYSNQRIITKISINEIIAGYLFRDGDILDVPNILREVADDYDVRIKEESEEYTCNSVKNAMEDIKKQRED